MADKKPRVGSAAWEEALRRDPAYVKETILRLAKDAGRGSRQAAEHLFGWLDLHPEMRSAVRELDDLATQTERAWVRRMAGGDEVAVRAIADDLAALKAELLGPSPSVTDKVLAGTVLVAHLGFQRASMAASLPTDKPEVRAARERLLSAAQRRLQDAVRGWHLYAGKKAKGSRPPGKLRLFEPAATA